MGVAAATATVMPHIGSVATAWGRLGSGVGVLAGDQLGQDRDGDLGRRAGADVQSGGGVQLRCELGVKLECARTASPRTRLATSATYGTPARRAAVSARSSSLAVRGDDQRRDAGEVTGLRDGQRSTAYPAADADLG